MTVDDFAAVQVIRDAMHRAVPNGRFINDLSEIKIYDAASLVRREVWAFLHDAERHLCRSTIQAETK